MSQTESKSHEATPVDDVRRVREEIHEEFAGDIRKVADHANQVAEEYREKLGLKVVLPPARDGRRDGTGG